MSIFTFLLIVNCFWLLPFPKVICRNTYAPVVELPLGKAVGIQVKTPDTTYNAYLGIPYAKIPIGSRRFEPPQAYSQQWIGERLFTQYRNSCMGLDNLNWTTSTPVGPKSKTYKVTGSEDCLYLNVHKGLDITTPAPVIFFIHGGFFSYSDRERYGPDYLMKENVIFVNFAYRVGPFGFMSTGTEVCSGNMGLKDIIQALNWVKVNIWIFGGNTDKITMAGIDAGAASAHLLYYSRISDELFNNAISYSGTAFSPWAFSQMRTVVGETNALAKQLNCRTSPAGGMLRCLKARAAGEIMQTLMSWKTFYFLPFSKFTPVDDSTFQHGVFLNNPVTMAREKTSKLNNWITGYTSGNGLYHVAEFLKTRNMPQFINERWPDYIANVLFYNKSCIGYPTSMQSKYRKSDLLVEFATDRNYRAPALYSADRMSERSAGKTYVYRYEFYTEKSRAAALVDTPWNNHGYYTWASHGDDIANVFYIPFYSAGQYTVDRRVRRKLMDIIVSFSSTGKPPTSWDWNSVIHGNPAAFIYDIGHQEERDKYVHLERTHQLDIMDRSLSTPGCPL